MFSYIVKCIGYTDKVDKFLYDNSDIAVFVYSGNKFIVLHKGFLDNYLTGKCNGSNNCVLPFSNASEIYLFLRISGINVKPDTPIIIPNTSNRSTLPKTNLQLLLLFPFSTKYSSLSKVEIVKLSQKYFDQCIVVHNFVEYYTELLANKVTYILPTAFITTFIMSILFSILTITIMSMENIRKRIYGFLELLYSIGLRRKDIYMLVYGFVVLISFISLTIVSLILFFYVEFLRYLIFTASLIGLVPPIIMMFILYKYDIFSSAKFSETKLAKIVLAVSIPAYIIYVILYSLSQFDYLAVLLLVTYAISVLIVGKILEIIYTLRKSTYIGAMLKVIHSLVLYLSIFAIFVILPASYITNVHNELSMLINSAYPDNINYMVSVNEVNKFYNYSVIEKLHVDNIVIEGYTINIETFMYFGKPESLGIKENSPDYPLVVLYNPCIPFDCPLEKYNGSTITIGLVYFSSINPSIKFKAKLLIYNKRLPPFYFETLEEYNRLFLLNMFKKYPSLFYYSAKRAVIITDLNYFIEDVLNESIIDSENYIKPMECNSIEERVQRILIDPGIIYFNYTLIGNRTLTYNNDTINICYLNISIVRDARYYFITSGYYVIEGDLPSVFHNYSIINLKDTRIKLFEAIYSILKPISSMFIFISAIASIGAVLIANNLVATQESILKLYMIMGVDKTTLLKGVYIDYLKAIFISSTGISLFEFAIYHFYIGGPILELLTTYFIQLILLFVISFVIIAMIIIRRSRRWY